MLFRSGNKRILHKTLKSTTNKVIAHAFVAELREKHDVEDAVFLIDGSHSLKDACRGHGLDLKYEQHGNRSSVEHIVLRDKTMKCQLSNWFSNAEEDTADNWLRSFAFAWNQLI